MSSDQTSAWSRYVPGVDSAIVTDSTLALLDSSFESGTVEAVWTASVTQAGLAGLLSPLAFDLTALAPFAVAVRAGGVIRVLVRGDITVACAGVVVNGSGVTTWREESIEVGAQERVVITRGAPSDSIDPSDSGLPILAGVVRARVIEGELNLAPEPIALVVDEPSHQENEPDVVVPVVAVVESVGSHEAEESVEADESDAASTAQVLDTPEGETLDPPVASELVSLAALAEPAVDAEPEFAAESESTGEPESGSFVEQAEEPVAESVEVPVAEPAAVESAEPDLEPEEADDLEDQGFPDETLRPLDEVGYNFGAASPQPSGYGPPQPVSPALAPYQPVAGDLPPMPPGYVHPATARQEHFAAPQSQPASATNYGQQPQGVPGYGVPSAPVAPGAENGSLPAQPMAEGEEDGDHDGATILAADLAALAAGSLVTSSPWASANQLPPEPPAPSIVLAFSHGLRVDLERPVLVGRAPESPAGANARLVPVPSPQQDISRTHVELRADSDGVLVTDLRSTNGTIVTRPGQPPHRIHPGEGTTASVGSRIDLGDGVVILVDLAH